MKSRDKGFRPWLKDIVSKAEEMDEEGPGAAVEPSEPAPGPAVREAVSASLQALSGLERRIRSRMEDADEAQAREMGTLLEHVVRLKEALAIPPEAPASLQRVRAAGELAQHISRQLRGDAE